MTFLCYDLILLDARFWDGITTDTSTGYAYFVDATFFTPSKINAIPKYLLFFVVSCGLLILSVLIPGYTTFLI